jgi:hypothetical protein
MDGRIERLEREVERLQQQLDAMRLSIAELVADVKPLTTADPPVADDADVRRALQLGVRYVLGAHVTGDIAEFGTMSGQTAVALAHALRTYGFLQDMHCGGPPPRRPVLHLFDSFEGLPAVASEVDRRSPHVRSGVWSPGSCRGVSARELCALCAPFIGGDRVQIHAGWFSDTLPRLPDDVRLALLHIDCDLYQSTKDVLDHCFGRGLVARGAILFFDDWSCNAADPALGERRAWAEAVEAFEIVASDGGEYGMAARKFIVHSYSPRAPR